MKAFKAALPCAVAVALSACAYISGSKEVSPVSENVARNSDIYAQESRTLSSLATLESAIHDYIKGEGKIPGKLDDLIPKYLAEIPVTELGIRKHSDNSRVENYPSSIIRDGVIDGSELRDTGHWGYTHNDRQVIVFVDCTHTDSRGKPWYKERGVF